MRRNLRGRNVLLTGASRGIGRCAAQRLAAHGARLLLTARTAPDLTTLAAELKASGAVVESLAADVTCPEDRQALMAAAAERLGGLDVLVNNAGVASFGDFAGSTEAVLRAEFAVNFFAAAELTRLAAPLLARGVQPAVVNVASICGRRGLPDWAEHCASKYALVGLTEALRGEFARFGIDVLLVLPGLTRADDLGRHLLRNTGRLRLDFEGAQSADTVAAALVRALERNRPETVVGFLARWVAFGERITPWFLDWILARKYRQDCAQVFSPNGAVVNSQGR
jgi:short-subunit dehydrogenase